MRNIFKGSIVKYFLIVLVLISCSKQRNSNDNALNYALTSTVSTLDPALSYDTVSAKVVYQAYETLFEYNYLIRPYQLKPLLAKEMPKISDDGLTYTIKLKENIYYHESKAFKGKRRMLIAEDFVNQVKRIAFISTKSPGWWLFNSKIKGLNKFRKEAKSDLSNFFSLDVAGIKALDKFTLKITLNQRYPQLQNALAMAFTSPMPAEAITFYENDLSLNMIGTGPYKLVHWNKNSSIKMIRNENYHPAAYPSNGDRFSYENNLLKDSTKKIPFIDQINFKIIRESQARWLNFLNKDIDLITLTKDHFSSALNEEGKLSDEFIEKNIALQVAPTLTYWWLSFNMKDPILGKNLNLRKAFAHAVNIEEYIKKFTNNIALKANSIYPPGVTGYSPGNELPYEYNISLAKNFLAKAGYPEGKRLPLFTYDVRGSSTVARQMGEFIQAELAKVGIKVKVVKNTFPGFLAKSRTGRLQIWQGGWAMDYPDPENVIQLLTTPNHPPGANASSYSNPEVDKLYNQLFLAENEEQVFKITQRVQQIVSKGLPWVMQFYSRNYILHKNQLKNFRQSDLIVNNFKYLRLEQ